MERPPIQNDREVSSFAITSKAVREFIHDLPDRSIVVVFPYSTFNLTMSQVKDSVSNLHEDDFIFDQSGWYVISKMESSNGWLRITFGWRFWIYANHYGFGSQFRQMIGPELCSLLDDEIGIAYATFQAGLTLDSLTRIMPGLHLCANRVQRKLPQNHLACRLISDPIALLGSAIDVWRNDTGYVKTRFSGGGFGLKGAFEGMAIAHTLNSFIDSQNNKAKKAHLERIELPLNFGFEHLRATQRFVE